MTSKKSRLSRQTPYNEILGEGAFKTIYKGFDEVNGLEIAWSTIMLSDKIFKSEKHLQSVCEEANLLKSLKHENIMRCFHSWVDYKKKTVNMITELFTSEVIKSTVNEKNRYKLQGKITSNEESVSMSLWIGECGNNAKKIQFEFFLQTDTICSVIEEMEKELELSDKDATLITKLMEELVAELVPEFDDVSQQSMPAECPCVPTQRTEQLVALELAAEQYFAVKLLLKNLKTKNSSGRDHHTSMSNLSDQTLLNKCEDKRDSVVMRRCKKKYSKGKVEMYFRSLKKLLVFFCGNKT
ncbi:Serine/threonine-protein kinase WNK8 [Bienertia sinuspersici]